MHAYLLFVILFAQMHIYLHKNDSICTNFGLFAQNEFYLHKTFATVFHTIIHPQTLNEQKLQNNHFAKRNFRK